MLNWKNVTTLAVEGNLEPDRTVEKSDEEWKAQLTDEQYYVTRQHGTERPHSSEMCTLFDPGRYACICCDTPLFDSGEKFDSGTGWPSFTLPLKENAISYHQDSSLASSRIEVRCNTCDAHLGHVFPDGPEPSGLRYCINAAAMHKLESADDTEGVATFGGGCFWCTEAVFQGLKGVISVESGYSGGETDDPTYREICSGETGHAEVIQISYDPEIISYEDLVRVHLGTHDPTTLNAQGADVGTQYRSVIFYQSDEERRIAEEVIEEAGNLVDDDIVTEVARLTNYFPAESDHQNYYANNPEKGFCQAVIKPKLAKLRKSFKEFLSH
jgi:peptide methionine sulfoxide reductase msrA/msrB